ncbi:unnamed protein product [Ranitomeya imitator]|uniref:Uncharacterized protein n=1 Tax=Ranitomeya imitator TaxID=111125 RepID=A0ABN9LIG2_9NEOB|nr:unnamed protein product [Ranitomeya imitator]
MKIFPDHFQKMTILKGISYLEQMAGQGAAKPSTLGPVYRGVLMGCIERVLASPPNRIESVADCDLANKLLGSSRPLSTSDHSCALLSSCLRAKQWCKYSMVLAAVSTDFTGLPGQKVPSPEEINGSRKAKKKLMAPNLSLTLDRSEGSILSEDLDESGDLDLDDLDTPSENSNEFEWEDATVITCKAKCHDDLPKPKSAEVLPKGSIPEYSAAEEKEESRRWRMFRIGEQDHRVDMSAIEPYKKVISHGAWTYRGSIVTSDYEFTFKNSHLRWIHHVGASAL